MPPCRTIKFGPALLEVPKLTPNSSTTGQPYRVILLNDQVNTFAHVERCLKKYIPNMTKEKARSIAFTVHFEGSATAWIGDKEEAERYYQLLKEEGLTMRLEKDV